MGLLEHVTALAGRLMVVLAFVWLGLVILDSTRGLGPALRSLSTVIWVLFGLGFAVKLIIAPREVEFLRRKWLTVLSLLLPAFRAVRVLRAFRFLRAARSVGVLRLATPPNRGMRAFSTAVGHGGVGCVAALTTLVTFAEAAGMSSSRAQPHSTRKGLMWPSGRGRS